MEEFTIYCTPEQTRQALKLGATIKTAMSKYNATIANKNCEQGKESFDEYQKKGIMFFSNGFSAMAYIIPTAEQMINWLRIKHKVFCNVIDEYSHGTKSSIYYIEVDKGYNNIFRSRHEWELSHDNAVMCVINLALEYLSNK